MKKLIIPRRIFFSDIYGLGRKKKSLEVDNLVDGNAENYGSGSNGRVIALNRIIRLI